MCLIISSCPVSYSTAIRYTNNETHTSLSLEEQNGIAIILERVERERFLGGDKIEERPAKMRIGRL